MRRLILPTAISAFNLIILKNFFQNIPEGLEESAKIDGCSDFGILFRIVLPFSMPAIATISLFYAVTYWNTYLSAILYLNDSAKWPIQVLLRQIVVLASGMDYSSDLDAYSAAAGSDDQDGGYRRGDASDSGRVSVLAEAFCQGRDARFDQGLTGEELGMSERMRGYTMIGSCSKAVSALIGRKRSLRFINEHVYAGGAASRGRWHYHQGVFLCGMDAAVEAGRAEVDGRASAMMLILSAMWISWWMSTAISTLPGMSWMRFSRGCCCSGSISGRQVNRKYRKAADKLRGLFDT